MLGFRAYNFQHLSLASGRIVFSFCLLLAAQIPAEQKSGCPRLFQIPGKGRFCVLVLDYAVGVGGPGGTGDGVGVVPPIRHTWARRATGHGPRAASH
jgi:hypothetical protein